MGKQTELICAWSGLAFVGLFVIGWIFLAGWFQPPLPSLRASEIADVFRDHVLRIRMGMIFMQFVGAANIPFSAAIMIVMLRMKGVSPVLAYSQLGAAICNSIEFIIPGQLFLATAYRPDRPVDITQFGFDQAMTILDNVTATAMLQFVVIAVAIFADKSATPAFPRWLGYVCVWGAVGFIPATMILFFKTGPLTWSGLWGWYLGVVIYFGWFCVQLPLLLKAIRDHYYDPQYAG